MADSYTTLNCRIVYQIMWNRSHSSKFLCKTLNISSKTFLISPSPSLFWEAEGNTHLSLSFSPSHSLLKTFLDAISKMWPEWMRCIEIQKKKKFRNLLTWLLSFPFGEWVVQSLKLDWTHMLSAGPWTSCKCLSWLRILCLVGELGELW